MFRLRYDEDGKPMQLYPVAALEKIIQMRVTETQARIDDPDAFKPQIAENQKLIALLRQEQEQYRTPPNS